MLVQRKFVAAAAVLSFTLAACGGGGSSSDPAAVANAADPTSVVDVAKHPASVSGTAIPPATSVSDSSGAVWTVKSGVVYRANQKAGFTDQVILVLWYAGKIYQENVTKSWWVWQNNAWVASADPRPAAPSNPASSTPPASSPPATTPPATTPPATTPPASTSAAIPFYGVNGHYVQGGLSATVPFATQAASMQNLGVRSYRQDMYNTTDIDNIASTVVPGLGSNVQVLPVIIAYPWNDPSLNGGTPTEASAYAYAYTIAARAATKFAGIPVVEFGNEYDLDDHNTPIASDGESITDYDNNTFPIWRGALRGAEDGWRSVDTKHTTKVIANATSGWLHFGFLDGLMTGTAPDGTTGHPKISPDIIQWHWYSDGGDFEKAVGTSGTYNVLARLKSSYNLPVIFTELGVNMDFSNAQAQTYINKTVAELVAARSTYNVAGFNWYELYDYPNNLFGVMSSATAQKPSYGYLKTAISANPVSQ